MHYMLEKRLILMMCLFTGTFALASFFAVLHYFDPYIFPLLAISLLSISFLLCQVSFCTFILYFCKKIYYRWEVHLFHVGSSLRQSFLCWLWIIAMISIISIGLPLLISSICLCILLLSFELFIQSFYE